MALLNKYKIRANTLIETIVASIIISLVFSIAMGIYLNILRNGLTAQKIQAKLFLDEYVVQCKEEKEFFDEEIQLEKDWTLIKEIDIYENKTHLIWLKIRIEDADENILASKELLIHQPLNSSL